VNATDRHRLRPGDSVLVVGRFPTTVVEPVATPRPHDRAVADCVRVVVTPEIAQYFYGFSRHPDWGFNAHHITPLPV
jgi:hypothetical protein